jgi:putative flavoprotein involved in K+ transport
MPERFAVAVVDAGQADLVTSHHLPTQRIEHVVFEHGWMGETWHSSRWDSFTFVTPNWRAQLPGHPYDGREPDGFTPRTEIVGYSGPYAAAVMAPVRVGIQDLGVEPTGEGGFRLHLLLTGD